MRAPKNFFCLNRGPDGLDSARCVARFLLFLGGFFCPNTSRPSRQERSCDHLASHIVGAIWHVMEAHVAGGRYMVQIESLEFGAKPVVSFFQ